MTRRKYKILFEPYGEKNWNKGYEGIRLKSWDEVYNFVKTLHIIEEKVLGEYLELIKNNSKNETNDILEKILQMKH